MGSNVDLVQVCQEQEEGKHEVKLEFKIEENDIEKSEQQVDQKENDGQSEEDLTERIVEKRLSWMAAAEAGQSSKKSSRRDFAPRSRPWRAGLESRDYKLRKTNKRKTKMSQRKKWRRRKSLRK